MVADRLAKWVNCLGFIFDILSNDLHQLPAVYFYVIVAIAVASRQI